MDETIQQLDALLHIYAVDPTAAFGALLDGGAALTLAGDFPTVEALTAAEIPAGSYATCQKGHRMRLGVAPAGVLSFAASKEDELVPGGTPALPGIEFSQDLLASAVRELPRLATRVFGRPLMIQQGKLDVILGVLGPRINLSNLTATALQVVAGFTAASAAAKASAPSAAPRSAEAEGGGPSGEKPRKPYQVSPAGVAYIPIAGTLVHKAGNVGAMSGLTSYPRIVGLVEAAIADDDVKGILLVIDSNGGECSGCYDAADAIFRARQKKPIYAAVDDNCFSAAFLLGSAAEIIYISRTGGIGSVGVVALHQDQSKADEQEGIKYEYIYAGERKIDHSKHQPLSATARENLQAEVDRLADMFAATVATQRGMDKSAVVATQAGLYFGENALVAKFADVVGTPDDAEAALVAEIERRQALAAPAAAASAAGATADATLPAAAAAEIPAPASAVLIAAADQVAADDAAAAAALAAVQSNVIGAGIATPAAANVTDLVAANEKAQTLALDSAVEIAELCVLAGRPDLTAKFIKARTPVASVREQLQALRADAGARSAGISAHILPDAGAQRDEQLIAAGWDYAIAKATGKPVNT